MEEKYKFTIRDDFYHFLTKIEYLQNVFGNAESYRVSRSTLLNETLRQNSELNRAEFVDKFGEEFLREHANIELFYKYILIHSIFVSAYSLFEQQFASISEKLEHHSKIKYNSIVKGRLNLDKYRKYLEKAHLVQNAFETHKLWKQVTKYRRIRNRIVHHAGRLNSKNEDRVADVNILSSYNVHIDAQTFEFFIRNEAFLYDFFKLIKEYLNILITEIAPVPAKN